MELNQGWFFIYDLKEEWNKYLLNQEENISIFKKELSDYFESFEKNISNELQLEISNFKPTDIESKDLLFLKELINSKTAYNHLKTSHNGILPFNYNGGKDEVERITKVFFQNKFKSNTKFTAGTDVINADVDKLKSFLKLDAKLTSLINLWNEYLTINDPSIAKLTFDNIEILAYNQLIKNQEIGKRKAVILEKEIDRLRLENTNSSSLLHEELDKTRKSYFQQLEKKDSEIKNLEYEIIDYKNELKFRKEHFMTNCILKVEIPELRVLYIVLAPLNLLFASKRIDFTRFCWFFDSLKFHESNSEKMIVNFKKASITAIEFGKFLYFIKTRLFNGTQGYSFEQWIDANFVFHTSHGLMQNMWKNIRAHSSTNEQYHEKLLPFIEMFDKKLPMI
jgi:hypothetical protein